MQVEHLKRDLFICVRVILFLFRDVSFLRVSRFVPCFNCTWCGNSKCRTKLAQESTFHTAAHLDFHDLFTALLVTLSPSVSPSNVNALIPMFTECCGIVQFFQALMLQLTCKHSVWKCSWSFSSAINKPHLKRPFTYQRAFHSTHVSK